MGVGYKKQKVIRYFLILASQLRITLAVLHNCESLFAIYSHFYTLYIKFV